MNTSISDAARHYQSLGFVPIPVEPKSKIPSEANWPTSTITWHNIELAFGRDRNIGILLGEPSKGLIDVDLDCEQARQLAAHFLAKTSMRFGRASARESHWLYRCPDAPSRTIFVDESMILEVRGTRTQTVFPPSVHISGEQIAFDEQGQPANVEWSELHESVSQLAIASLLLKKWNPGTRHQLALGTAGMLAHAGWSQAKVEHLIEVVSRNANDDDVADRLEAVATTFKRVNAGDNVVGQRQLADLLGETSATKLRDWSKSAGNNLQPLKEQPEPIDLQQAQTDVGAAAIFSERMKNDLIFVSDERQWYRRTRHTFQTVSGETLQGLVSEFLLEAVGSVRSVHQFQQAKNVLSRNKVNATIELSRSKLEIAGTELDRNNDLVGCADGSALSVSTGELVDPGFELVSKRLGTNFDPAATCPVWFNFLDRIFAGDQDVIQFVQRAFGYTLTGTVSEQCLFLVIGSGANGKSTLIETLRRLMGDYATSTPMQTIMISRSEQTNDLAGLSGKRLVSASEGEPGQRLAESKIKLMTGGDRIKCRKLYKDYVELTPQFKLWVLTNNLPSISGTDEAIWRRIHVVNFPVTIPIAERDGRLIDRLSAELPGILNWGLAGYRAWSDAGLRPPQSVAKATERYRTDNDTVGQFVSNCCETADNSRTLTKTLYDAYVAWCGQSGIRRFIVPMAASAKAALNLICALLGIPRVHTT